MKTYDRLKTILENYPDTRNSDKRLIWKFWEEEGLIDYGDAYGDFIKECDFLKATSPESIRRARQKIQQLYPELGPTSELVRKRRGIKSATKGTFIYREDNGQGIFI
jgi:hypothetical protein